MHVWFLPHRTPSNTFVGVGAHDRTQNDNYYVRHTVSVINQHRDYNPTTISNDVSVLILTEAIEIVAQRQAVCPPGKTTSGNADGYEGDRLIVSGWGTQSEGGQLIYPACPLECPHRASCRKRR